MKEIIDELDEIRMLLKRKALLDGDTQCGKLEYLIGCQIEKLRQLKLEAI